MTPVKIVHHAIGESLDGAEQKEFLPGIEGQYVAHIPGGMVVLRIDGKEWIIHPGATDIR